MKELSIEEKAKAYDEAIKRVNDLISRCKTNRDRKTMIYRVNDIESIFPELKESEDERIELLNYLYDVHDDDEERARWIAWLEKQGEHAKFINGIQVGDKVTRNEDGVLVNLSQLNRVAKKQGEQKPVPKFKVGDTMRTLQEATDGYTDGMPVVVSIDEEYYHCNNELIAIKDQDDYEYPPMNRRQKPADKVEPKFNVGDWIIDKQGTLRHIINVDKGGYQTDGGWISHDTYEKTFHLWTIQDAKDGDVLADGNLPFIFKKIDTNKYSYAYCGISVDDGFKIESDGEFGEWTWMQDIKPATKEQRDLLFQKMKEAGYEWDADKLELRKIEQKPAWGEEDEKMLNHIICDIESLKEQVYCKTLCDEEIDFLKSLKERYTWKPSDEQMSALSKAIAFVFDSNSDVKHSLESLYNELKKL